MCFLSIAKCLFGCFFRFAAWSSLKTVGSSYISIATIIVPVFGFLIYSSNLTLIGLEQANEIGKRYGFELGEVSGDRLLRLKMTYVGLSIVGYATIAFQVFCPKSVQSYKDEREYTLDSGAVLGT